MTRAVALALAFASASPALDPWDVLRRGDPGRLSPDSFRALLRLWRDDRSHDIEVWHAGRNRTLVRLLSAKELGKFLLRRDADLWLVSPRTRQPTRLPPAYRLYGGASLDEVLGRLHFEDYEPVDLTEEKGPDGDLLSLRLHARDPGSMLPRARLLVRKGDFRAVKVEYWLRSGKPATVVEFQAWEAGRPRRLAVRDLIRKEGSVTVDVLKLEERPVPADLFDLEDGSARKALPVPLAAAGSP